MSDPRLELILAAKNLASGEIGRLDKDLGKLKGGLTDASKEGAKSGNMLGNLGKFALAAGAGIVLGAGAAMADFTKKAIEDEQVHARLKAALIANVPAWDGNEAALTKNINASERLGFTNDQLEASFATLATATHDMGKATELQAAAMDLARLKGIDLQTASEALVKVEGGHYRMLQSLGINLKANATQQEALTAVRAAAAGQAEAFAKTGAGQFAAMNAKLEDSEKALGQIGLKFIPIVTQAVNALTVALDAAFNALTSMGVGVDNDMSHTAAAAARGSQSAQAHLRNLPTEAAKTGQSFVDMGDHVSRDAAAMAGGVGDAADAIAAKAGAFTSATNLALRDPITSAIKQARRDASVQAELAMGDIASKIHQSRSNIETAMASVTDGLKHQLTKAQEIAQLKGELTGKALARGLRSADPEVQAEAVYAKGLIEARLAELQGKAQAYGNNTMIAYGNGIRGAKGQIIRDVEHTLKAVVGILKASSPPGPDSPLHHIQTWGRNTMHAFGDGAREAAGQVASSFRFAAGAGAGGLAMAGAGGPAVGSGSGRGGAVVVHSHLYLDGREIASSVDQHMYSRLAPGGAGGNR